MKFDFHIEKVINKKRKSDQDQDFTTYTLLFSYDFNTALYFGELQWFYIVFWIVPLSCPVEFGHLIYEKMDMKTVSTRSLHLLEKVKLQAVCVVY